MSDPFESFQLEPDWPSAPSTPTAAEWVSLPTRMIEKKEGPKYPANSFPRQWLPAPGLAPSFDHRLLEAIQFAIYYHHGQTRKNADAWPYVVHLTDTLMLMMTYGAQQRPWYTIEVATAAILHDVLEDTNATSDEVEAHFGPTVLRYILACSDNKGDSKRKRKEDELTSAMLACPEVKAIKAADKLSSLRDVLDGAPPASWAPGEADGYIHWQLAIFRRATAGVLPLLDAHVAKVFADHNITPTESELDERLAAYYGLLDRVYRTEPHALGRIGFRTS